EVRRPARDQAVRDRHRWPDVRLPRRVFRTHSPRQRSRARSIPSTAATAAARWSRDDLEISSPMDLSIICVNWNSADYLRECIASVYAHTRSVSFEIIVVDNASTRPGLDALVEQFPDVKITKSPKNLGFAGANNLGFQQSIGEYVLFLNPDTKLLEPSID